MYFEALDPTKPVDLATLLNALHAHKIIRALQYDRDYVGVRGSRSDGVGKKLKRYKHREWDDAKALRRQLKLRGLDMHNSPEQVQANTFSRIKTTVPHVDVEAALRDHLDDELESVAAFREAHDKVIAQDPVLAEVLLRILARDTKQAARLKMMLGG